MDERTSPDNAEPSKPTGVERFAAAVQKENARRISLDWRIPIPSVFAFVVGGICSATGLVYYAGGVRQSFADSVEKVAIHERRIGDLETGLVSTNLAASEISGDVRVIKSQLADILEILRQQRNDRAPR